MALSWCRVYGKPNNVGGPYIGEGLSTDYRVDHGEGWAVLSIYGANARPDARGEDARHYRRAADAKRAASLIEGS